MGLSRATRGQIAYNGSKSLVGLAPHHIAQLGIGFVPDDRIIFPDLTVRENLEVAAGEARVPKSSPGPSTKSTICFPCCGRSTNN